MMKLPYRSVFFMLIFLSSLLDSGCAHDPLKEAFQGAYPIGENNKIINEYCQSCHVHAKFSPDSHIDEMNLAYQNRLFRTTNECRTCHYIRENFFGDILRRHRRPRSVAKGRYNDFIRAELARKKEETDKVGKE